MSTLQPYQQRVVDEKAELDMDIDKLNDFLHAPGVKMSVKVADVERGRLVLQLHYMRKYSQILSERIAAFT